jgi:predicted MFS family arabinose efflux permease
MAGADTSLQSAAALDPGTRIVILSGGFIASLALMAIASVLPQIDHALARTASDHMLVKQLVGAVALAMVVGAATVGFLIDRLGITRVLIGAAILYALAGTAGLYLGDLQSLLVSRLLVGVSAAAIQVACMTLINTRLEGGARARWMGLHISVAMLTAIFAHPVAGMLGEISWRLPFALYGMGLVLVPAALLQHARAVSRPEESRSDGMRTSFLSWFPLRYLLLAFAIGSLALMPSVQVPFLLREKGLLRPSAIALVLTADSFAGAIMAMLYGRARAYISAHVAFAISFATAAAGLMLAALAESVAAVIAGLLVYGLGIGWFVPNLMTTLSVRVAPGHQGRAAGIVKAAHFLSAPVSVALVEPLARSHGPASTLVVASALAIVCLLATGIKLFRR